MHLHPGLEIRMYNDPSKAETAGVMTARRKLLRGALAAPTVAIIPSGSAWAAASNLRCVGNQAGLPFPANRTTAPLQNDTTLWTRLAELRPNGDNPVSTFYVVGGRWPPGLPRAVGYTLPDGHWQEFNVSTNTDVPNTATGTQPSGNGVSATYIANADRWAALRFDRDGKLTGVGQLTGDVWLTTSCLTSFAVVQLPG
jgi:hypothetical protein